MSKQIQLALPPQIVQALEKYQPQTNPNRKTATETTIIKIVEKFLKQEGYLT